jgi:cholesterol transport system auxiliary component
VIGRRTLLAAGSAALAGCSVLPSPTYVQRTTWSLAIAPPVQRHTRPHGKVLLVQEFQAAPGLDQLGVQWLNANGSIHVDFYNLWEVPPSQAATYDARRWLAASGLFAAVVGPDSGLIADLILEAELTRFMADPPHEGRAALSITLLNQRAVPARVLIQRTISAIAPMPAATPAGVVAGQRGALAEVLQHVKAVLARYA